MRTPLARLTLVFLSLGMNVPLAADDTQPPPIAAAAASQPESATTQPQAAREELVAQESLARFQQVLARRPLHGPAFQGLVKHYVDAGRLSDLVTEYESNVAALPDQAALRIVLARLYLRAGQAAKAADLLEAIQQAPGDSRDDEQKLLVLKSEVFQQVGRNDAALAMLDEAQRRARTVSDRFRLAEALADLHLRANEPSRAAEALDRLAGEFPDNYLHRRRIADALSQRNLHERAVEEYRATLRLVENQPDKRCETLRQLGKSLEQLERHQEAIDAYSEAVGLVAGGHWLQQELNDRIVSLYRSSNRLDDLIAYCRAQLERSPEQTSMRVLLAEVLTLSGDADGARRTLAEAVELFPKDRSLSERWVHFLERAGDLETAASEYERIIAQHPDDVELYITYGQFLAQNKQLNAARNQWKRVLNSEVTDANLALRLGGLFEPHELYDDAAECYERAIRLAPTRNEGYTALSRLALLRGQREAAVAALRRMAEANPQDAATHAILSLGLVNLGQTDEALAAISRACALDPRQVNYQISRADLLVQAGRVGEALQARRAALDAIDNPGQRAAAIDVLVAMHHSSNQLDALRAAEIARLEGAQDNVLSLLLLARAADFERRFSEARQWLTRVLEIDPTHEEARRQLARLYEAAGDTDAAVEAYLRLCEQHPTRARQYFQAIADLKLRYNDKAGAIETFDRMVRSSPGNASVLKSVAEQLVRLQEFDKAISQYEECLRIQPESAETRLAYGKALQEAGRLDDAMTAYKATSLQRSDRDSAAEALGKLHEAAAHLGRLDELLAELHARIETNPDDTPAARMLAELLIREFEYSRATEMLGQVLRHRPRDADLHLVRAEVLRRLTRFDDAIETYRSVLRIANVDRDFVLGELGKAFFEAGRVDQARTAWRQINHKLYAASLLRNNGLTDDAIETLREGIRLKPDDFGLHRNLVGALQAAGKVDEALEAARRLIDLEPDNVFNIQQLAQAYLERNNRAAAAEVAARMFAAGVVEKKDPHAAAAPAQSYSSGVMSIAMISLQSAWSGFPTGGPRSNLERAVDFFVDHGLLAELEEILTKQLELQPDNAALKRKSVELFSDTFGKPEIALKLLRELETATFPIEQQEWLGQCSQREYLRVQQFQLIGSKPGLRDQRLAVLEPKDPDGLDRDETLELAAIRQSQGASERAIELFERAVRAESTDVVALSGLVDALVRAERFKDAEPHVETLCGLLAAQRERIQAEMVERVRRDFVRTLPIPFQMRVSEDLLRDIAHKWTIGQSMMGDFTGFVQTMGYFRARLTLATIYAKTGRMEQAREIWKSLEPSHPADTEGWTMLAGVAQLHEQTDLAYAYYEKALGAAKLLAADPLLQQIYGSSLSQMWYGGEKGIDTAFNKIVEAFAGQNKLAELYDFLRATDQTVKARRVAEQYKLYDALIERYRARVAQAAEEFRRDDADAIHRSVAYLTEACKLAELFDQTGEWNEAFKVYEQYLKDYPDELALLTTLSEVAEAQEDYAEAVEWERRAIEAKQRLQRRARDWALRSIYLTPTMPQILGSTQTDSWSWQQRWGKTTWWYGRQNNPLEQWPSWMRMARLYLSLDNVIAAADAMERAIGVAGAEREQVANQILALIQQRQLTARMLPVIRSLAVQLPTDEEIQLAFAESLEANNKKEVAGEVYQRMIRRGVSDIGVLARVRDKLRGIQPAAAEGAIDTLERLEAAVAADPGNANHRLRLAKAYYYSLRVDEALEVLTALEKSAPHLEGLHDLLIDIYTLRDDSPRLVEALQTKVKRTRDDDQRRQTRRQLVERLLALGRSEEALTELAQLVDPKEPSSYQYIGTLLHYFGRHDEALEQFKLGGRSQQRGGWGGDDVAGPAIVRALVLKGDVASAADRIVQAASDAARQASQYGGMAGMYAGFFDDQSNVFQGFAPLFVLRPALLEEVRTRLQSQHEARPDDPQTAKQLMQLFQAVGRSDQADAILEKLAGKGASDAMLTTRIIDRAIERRQYEKAIELATKWIEQQPKPQLPPGVPPQFAGMMSLLSPRNQMLCKLGDVYWKMGDAEKAFETYRRIVDEKVDESRIAYAGICAVRGRLDEARQLVEEALKQQKIKSPMLLQFRAMLAMLDRPPEEVFDILAEAAEIGGDSDSDPFMISGRSGGGVQTLVRLARQANLIDRFAEFMRKRIARNPSDWSNYQLLATTYYESGRLDDAMCVLDEAEKIKSLRREALSQRLSWQEGYASAEELIESYRVLIEASEKKVKRSRIASFFGSPRDNDAGVDTQPLRERLGGLLWNRGDFDDAEKTWSERLNLNAAASHLSLAKQFMSRDAFDRAERAYRKAVELEPDSTPTHRGLARLSYYSRNAAALAGHLREIFLREYSSSQESLRDDDLRVWALDILRDPATAERLRGHAGDDADLRLAVAIFTGDWAEIESLLTARLKSAVYDPMTWTLWARLHERKGNWSEAARAWDYLLRLRQTTITDHRDQLKLVLAGKHIKDAAAGSKHATMSPGATPPTGTIARRSRYSRYYGYGGFGGYGSDQGISTRLAGIYIKLDQFDKAELLYLFGDEGETQYLLPMLSNLMWRNNARPRAIELMELAVVLSDDMDTMPRYAGILAETGRAREAVDLLVRAYRSLPSQEQSSFMPYWGSRWYGSGSREDSFEGYQETACADALYEILRRHGLLEEVMASLAAQATAEPDDMRLGRLVLSLQIRDRRWEQARESLAARCQARPEDLSLKAELVHALMQLSRWDEALAVVAEIRAELKESGDSWIICEAFLRLLKGDADGAVHALSPLLAAPLRQSNTAAAPQIETILVAAQKYDALADYLEARYHGQQAGNGEKSLLFRVYLQRQRWTDAARLALDEFWKQQSVFDETSPWYQSLTALCASSGDGGHSFEVDPKRTEDAALIALARNGPAAGVAAFTPLIEQQPDNVNARRGLVLALTLAGELPRAVEANQALLNHLSSRRREVWHELSAAPLNDLAVAQLETMKTQGMDGAAALGMSMSFDSIIGQVLAGGEQGQSRAARYDVLWRAHQAHHVTLLARAGQADKLAETLRTHAEYAEAEQRERPRYRYYGSYDSDDGQNAWFAAVDGGAFDRNWRGALHTYCLMHRLYEPLADEMAAHSGRLSPRNWAAAADVFASLGRIDEARCWRSAIVEHQLTGARAADEPSVNAAEFYDWYWWSHPTDDQGEIEQMRQSLQSAAPPKRPTEPAGEEGSLSEADPDGDTSNEEDATLEGPTGPPMQAWQFALMDPGVAEQLLALESQVGPGWGDTQTVGQLVAYFRTARMPQRTIALLERACEGDVLLRSRMLTEYLRACYAAKDYARIEKTLDAILQRSPSLESDVQVARLMVLRHQGKAAEADKLEAELMSRSRREAPNPARFEPCVIAGAAASAQTWQPSAWSEWESDSSSMFFARSYDGYGRSRGWNAIATHDLGSIPDLAQALGVRYQHNVRPGDLMLSHIREAYRRHGLYRDAARIVAIELEQADPQTPPRDRTELLQTRALLLSQAGDFEAARTLIREVESFWQAEARSCSRDPTPYIRLEWLYNLKATGPDWAGAYQAMCDARERLRYYDRNGTKAADYLYKLGRLEDAWGQYRDSMTRGYFGEGSNKVVHQINRINVGATPRAIYQAGIAAHAAGDDSAARSLLRQALWRHPTHALAKHAQEILDE